MLFVSLTMKLIVDERERDVFGHLNAMEKPSIIQIEKQVLPLGDFLVTQDDGTPIILCERKSFSDLFSSIKDGRYEEQSYRLSNDARFPNQKNIVYIIEGMYSQMSRPGDKKLLCSTITSLMFFKGYSVLRTANTKDTADTLIYMVDKLHRDFLKGRKLHGNVRVEKMDDGIVGGEADAETLSSVSVSAPISAPISAPTQCYSHVVKTVKKDNITRDNIGNIMLSQVPGMSATTAQVILAECDNSIYKLIEVLQTDPTRIYSLKIGEKQRKISKKVVETMIDLLCIKN